MANWILLSALSIPFPPRCIFSPPQYRTASVAHWLNSPSFVIMRTPAMPQCICLAHAIAHQAGGGTSSNSSAYHSRTLFSTSSNSPLLLALSLSLSLCLSFHLSLFHFLADFLPPPDLPLCIHIREVFERWAPSACLVFGTQRCKLL